MKVGEKTNFGRLATIFQICSMDADILSWDDFNMVLYLFLYNCLFLEHYDSAGFAGSTAMHFSINWRKELINKKSATSEAFSNLQSLIKYPRHRGATPNKYGETETILVTLSCLVKQLFSRLFKTDYSSQGTRQESYHEAKVVIRKTASICYLSLSFNFV